MPRRPPPPPPPPASAGRSPSAQTPRAGHRSAQKCSSGGDPRRDGCVSKDSCALGCLLSWASRIQVRRRKWGPPSGPCSLTRVSPSPFGGPAPSAAGQAGAPELAGRAPGTHRCSVSARPRRPCPRGRGTRRTRAAGWGAASTAGGRQCRPAGSRPLGAGGRGSSQTVGTASGASDPASDPLLPRLLLHAFSRAFDVTLTGWRLPGVTPAGAGLCPAVASTGARTGGLGVTHLCVLEQSVILLGRGGPRLWGLRVGETGLLHSGRLVRPLLLTEWGAWGGEGKRATQPGSWAFQTGRGGRGWGQGLLAPPGFVLTA